MSRFSLLTLAVTVAAFGVPTVVSAADAPKLTPLTVTKECSQYTGANPSFCTITESSLDELPPGTKVLYYGPLTNNPNFSTNNIVLDDGNGSTALGNCIVDFGAGPKGICAFYAGSGRLQGFMAIVAVTVDGAGMWHWEGGYELGAAQ